MKCVLILLLLPLYSLGQTIHIKDDRAFYEGREKITGTNSSDVISRLQQAMSLHMRHYKTIEASNDSIKAKGQLRLKTPYHLVRTVDYIITAKATTDGYEYTVDSISVKEKKRGFGTTKKSSEEILEEMEDFGKQAEHTERILNEIDMRIQQLLVLLRKDITSGKAVMASL